MTAEDCNMTYFRRTLIAAISCLVLGMFFITGCVSSTLDQTGGGTSGGGTSGGTGGGGSSGGGTEAAGTFGTVDGWTSFAGQTAGTPVTPDILASATYPTSGSLCTWTLDGTGLQVGASQGSLGGSVDVGGTTYAATTQTLSLSVPDSGGLSSAICNMSTPATYLTSFSYVTNNGPIVPGGATLFDRMVITDAGGDFVAAQLEDGQWRFKNGGYDWDIETDPDYTTTHSKDFIPAVVGQRYGVSACWNSATGEASLYVYVPLSDGNLGLVGSITSNYPNPPNRPMRAFRIGNNESGVSQTPSFVEDAMFQITSPACPLAPSTVETIPTYVAGAAGNGSGTTATLSYTPHHAGDAEVVFACEYGVASSISLASTENKWNQLSPTTTTQVGGSSATCAAFDSFGVSGNEDKITATYGDQSDHLVLHVVELANVTAVDQNTGFETATSESDGTFSGTSVTPTANPEVAIGFGICSQSCYGGQGFSTIAQDSDVQAATTVGILTSTASTAAHLVDKADESGNQETIDLVTLK